jgi:transposase
VREILYIAGGVAGRYEADFMAFRKRLLEAGKPVKVARVAQSHKLLVRLNAKARKTQERLQLKALRPECNVQLAAAA